MPTCLLSTRRRSSVENSAAEAKSAGLCYRLLKPLQEMVTDLKSDTTFSHYAQASASAATAACNGVCNHPFVMHLASLSSDTAEL